MRGRNSYDSQHERNIMNKQDTKKTAQKNRNILFDALLLLEKDTDYNLHNIKNTINEMNKSLTN